jgi:hypothetical protein
MSAMKSFTSPLRRGAASRPGGKVPIFPWNGIFTIWLAGFTLLSAQGCSQADASTPLADTRGSEKALVQSVLDAVAAKDEATLRSLLVTKEEYARVLWPEMPDQKYTPFSFVWSLNAANNRKGLNQLLERYGGMEMEVVSVELPEDPEVYDSFTLYPGTKVTVRRKDTGQEGTLPSFDVLVKYGRVWKLMNYDEL